jgi:hypothetical protein
MESLILHKVLGLAPDLMELMVPELMVPELMVLEVLELMVPELMVLEVPELMVLEVSELMDRALRALHQDLARPELEVLVRLQKLN